MKTWGAGEKLVSERGVHAVASGPGADIARASVRAQMDSLCELAAACRPDDPASRLDLLGGIDRVFQDASSDAHAAGFVAHLTVVVVVGERFYVGHSGDTRLDRYRMPTRERLVNALPYHELGRLPVVDADLFEVVVQPGDLFLLGTPDAIELSLELMGRRARQLAAGLVDLLDDRPLEACVVLYLTDGASAERMLSAILSRQPLFEHFDRPALRRLRPYLREVYLGRDELVFEAGDESLELFLVVAGQLDVQREGLPLTALGSGDHFGEVGLALGQPRTATVRSCSACHLLALDRDRLNALLTDRPDLAGLFMQGLVESLAERLADLTTRLVEASR
ncbi:MAG TPA: cyclic nucleotide-binding domain-containing protein [Myxococcota bacterium]|nr:cyclic nucleotide-binding domain-containing protein [Myxococcota bacterium]